jgi:hypothetical protein
LSFRIRGETEINGGFPKSIELVVETLWREVSMTQPAVFIANFGLGNYEWANCLERATIATMNDAGVHHYWEAGNKEGYIAHCLAHAKTAAGNTPTRPVASRWFNLMTIISESQGDIWIHREKDELWWTISRPDPPTFHLEPDPTSNGFEEVYVCHKPCEPWSNVSREGTRLIWNGLHPKAKEFLFTEGTLQQLSLDNAAYALALIDGRDLSDWHERRLWKAKAQSAGRSAAKHFNAKERSIYEMVQTTLQTVKASSGQSETRTIKNKQLGFHPEALQRYLDKLLSDQDGTCAITGLPLQFRGEQDDDEFLPSLDRIDSDGHYEEGNLQIVCRFIDRWKGADPDPEFKRLIDVVRTRR